CVSPCSSAVFFHAPSYTDVYPLSLHDALPILLLRRVAALARHLQARLLGELGHRIDETHAGMVHQEADGAAMRAAAEAMIELLRSEEHTSELQSREKSRMPSSA